METQSRRLIALTAFKLDLAASRNRMLKGETQSRLERESAGERRDSCAQFLQRVDRSAA